MESILVFKGMKKYFPGTKALDWNENDTIEIYPGEIHGLVGENGAGKSTLFQILMGIYTRTEGEIIYNGEPFNSINAHYAEDHGISIIMQQPNFAHNMTVAENIFMSRDSMFKNSFGFIDWKKMNAAARDVLDELSYTNIDPKATVGELPFEARKQVEIARAFSSNPKVLLVDETSAAVSKESVVGLYRLLRKKRDEGIAIMYISHFIDEVHNLCDRVSILRDGQLVAKMKMDESVTEDVIIKNMVGRDISSSSYRSDDNSSITDIILETKGLSGGKEKDFDKIDLAVHKAEIVGIAGIGGCGSSEFGRALFGYSPITSGEIFYKGKSVTFKNPTEAVKNKIGYIPKDRDLEGLVLMYDLVVNISEANLSNVSHNCIIDAKKEKSIALDAIKTLKIKTPSERTTAGSLSGGNRQKVAIAKWTVNNSDLLIINSPTRGVDVGAKYEIYKIMEYLKNKGKAIILISDELPELIGMSDRIYCFRAGKVSGEFVRGKDCTEENVIAKMV